MSDAARTQSAFEFQRRWLSTARRATQQGVETQRRLVRAVTDTTDAQRAATEQATAVFDSAFENAIATARASGADVGLEEMERTYDDGRSSMEDAREEWWDATERTLDDGARAADGLLDAYADLLDAGFGFALDANDVLASNVEWMTGTAAWSRGGREGSES